MQNIGMYGGTFNPIHLGHQLFAEQFMNQLNLVKLHIIPTFISPFKQNNYTSSVMNFHRMQMLKITFKENVNIIIDEFELNKQVVSYTIDTIKYLKNIYPDNDLYMLIGEDNAIHLDKWKNYEEILELVKLVVILRDKNDGHSRERMNNLNHFKNIKLNYLDTPIISISSTLIRDNFKNKLNNIEYLNSKIFDYINLNNLYQ